MNKNVKKPTPSAASTSTSKNNNSTLIIIIAAAVIIIGGGVFAALKLHWFGIGQEPEPVVEVVPMEEPVIDTVPKEDTIKVVEEQPKVIEEEPAPEVDPNTKRYYIVAGSFKVATNAENFSQKLIDEGYKSEVIVRSNGYHTVSYKTLYEWNEALSEWRNMRNINSQTWILVK